MSSSQTATSVPSKRLAASILSTDLAFSLNNILSWKGIVDGTTKLTTADFGTRAFGVFRNSTNSQLELFEWDPTTIANSSITIISRGLSYSGGTTANAAPAYNWNSNETLCELGSHVPQLFEQYMDKTSDETVAGIKTFSSSPVVPTGGTGTQAANATDIANAVTGASGLATTSVYGTVKMSTAPVVAGQPTAVGDNDGRVPTQNENDALQGTGTPSNANRFVTADTDALKELLANKDTDTTLAANSDVKYASQKAIKAYVDGKIPTLAQFIPFFKGTNTASGSSVSVTSITDGSVLFVASQGATAASLIVARFVKDSITSQYYCTNLVSYVGAGITLVNPTFGITTMGNYVYTSFRDSSSGNNTVVRFDKADLANAVIMTISGTGIGSSPVSMWNDGTNLYISNNSINQFNKYSVSGTTITFVSAITFTTSGNPQYGVISNGVNVWIADQSSGSSLNIRKYTIAGGAVVSTTTLYFPVDAVPNNGSIFLCLLGTSILGYGMGHTIESNTAVVGAGILLKAITLP